MDIRQICQRAKDNAEEIAYAGEKAMNRMLTAIADTLRKNADFIIEENEKDIAVCTKPANIIDRLRLNAARIEGMAEGLEALVKLKCPVGELIEEYTAQNGLKISKVRVPMGVVGIIYEARPNVTADAIGLCIKSGNAAVLRGSKDAIKSNRAIVGIIKTAIKDLGFNGEFIQLIEDTSREGATEFMRMNGLIDVLIPRGGAGLIKSALENATVPVIETGTGNCHIYAERTADLGIALSVLINAKTQRDSVCNAAESLLVDEEIAERFLPKAFAELKLRGVEVRGCERCLKIDRSIKSATEQDYYEEFSAPIISVKVVGGVEDAIAHINKYGTHHSDSIITQDKKAAGLFLERVDSAAVYENASTRFTDGFEFGLGAEMGISTQKLHARGPMGLKELTSYKYVVRGNGQVRS